MDFPLMYASVKHNISNHLTKQLLSVFMLALMLASLVSTALASTGEDAYVNEDEINVRSGPGTQYDTVKFSGSGIMLYRGQYVRIIDTQRGADGADWHQIVFLYAGYTKLGFMRSDFITRIGDDSAYRAYLNKQGFPQSYQPYLRALYAASGGKWTFVADKTGLNWADALEIESTLGMSLIHGSYSTALRSTAPGAYNSQTGVWREYEPGWYAASGKTVAYYLDPRSYLTSGACMAFQVLSGDGTAATSEQVAMVLKDCKWATSQIINEFVRAGAEANVSAIYLAVKARGEIGTGATKNASGYTLKKEDGGGTYYNFFNIGAYGGDNPNYNGILYARDEGWDTSYKALLGGAQFIARSYIARGQDTQYLQRFNLTSTNTYSHQYATDITYAYQGGRGTYWSYVDNGLLDMSLVLSVPILEGMPGVTKLPTGGQEEEYIPTSGPDAPTVTPDFLAATGKPYLKWKAVDGAAEYQVYRAGTRNGTYRLLGTTTNLNYTDTTASTGYTYFYNVKAVSAGGVQSDYSAAISAISHCARPTVTPDFLASTGKPYLKWKAVSGAGEYQVYRAATRNGTYRLLGATTKLNYTDTTASTGYTYFYRIKAVSRVKTAANSVYSDAVSAVSRCARPMVTADYLTATGKPYLKWKAVSGAAEYQIYRAATKGGTYKLLGTTTKLNYTDTTASTGYTYFYRIKAVSRVKTAANSVYSNAVGAISHCAKPVVEITASGGKPKLTWSAVSGAAGYQVYRATSSGGTYTKIADTTAKTYTDQTAKAGTTYYYKVKAVSRVKTTANSAYSAVKSIQDK